MNRIAEHPLFYILVLGLFAAASYWLSINSQKSGNRTGGDVRLPDYEADDFSLVTLNRDGSLQRRLEGKRLRHFGKDRGTELIAPNFLLFEPRAKPWRARAEQGWLSGDGQILFLTGKVSLRRDASANQPDFLLETRNVTLELADDHLTTDAPVLIRSGANEARALGMDAWFGDQARVKLRSRVKARYTVESL